MTIQNPAKFVSTLWDWGILDGCFGQTRIKPTDVDGFVERNGKFLLMETKSPGVEVPMGQMITLQTLVQVAPFTVFVIWGETNNPQRILAMKKEKTVVFEDANVEKLRELVLSWFNWANRHPMNLLSDKK